MYNSLPCQQCALAKTPSDSVVLKRTPRNSPAFKEHKSTRRARKAEISAALAAQKQGLPAGISGGKRKRDGEADGQEGAAGLADGVQPPPVKRAIPQLPDEYLPPNPLLFIQNLPEDNSATREELETLFVDFDGLREVRMIPGKAIAFVEYASAEQASRAREGLNGRKVGTQVREEAGEEVKGMRITFARV
jgi:U2 small nuclear ribonucleoprotein B''